MDDDWVYLRVGDHVQKRAGYEFDSIVVSVFRKLDGQTRVVCESKVIPGLLHIFSEGQLRKDPRHVTPTL